MEKAEVRGVVKDESVLPPQCPLEKNNYLLPSAESTNRRCFMYYVQLCFVDKEHMELFCSCFVLEAIVTQNENQLCQLTLLSKIRQFSQNLVPLNVYLWSNRKYK